MKPKPFLSIVVGILLVLSLVAGLVACTGEDQVPETGATVARAVSTSSSYMSPHELLAGEDQLLNEDLSTFESKDPFVQQVTASTDVPPDGGETPGTVTTLYTSTTYYTTTTRYYNTTTTWWTTTTRPSTTTTTKPATTTTTTVAHVHTLKILSVETVGGAAAVTFRVDNSVYKSRPVGDVVSTSWGQVQIVDIALSSKVVTLLHGSETITLEVGQQIYE